MLTAFPLSEIERVVRRTALTAIAIGVIGAIVAVLMGQPYFVPGLGLGLVLAIGNHRVFQSSAMRFTTAEGVVNRKPFAGSVALQTETGDNTGKIVCLTSTSPSGAVFVLADETTGTAPGTYYGKAALAACTAANVEALPTKW